MARDFFRPAPRRHRRDPWARLLAIVWALATVAVAAWLCWGEPDDHRSLLVAAAALGLGLLLGRRPILLAWAFGGLAMLYPLLGVGPVLDLVLIGLVAVPAALHLGQWVGPAEPRRCGPVRRYRGPRL